MMANCTALHCTALYCTALYYTALHCTALHCTALHCIALHCRKFGTREPGNQVPKFFALLTLSHLKSFLESAVPPIRLFLMIIMMPRKRCVAKENYFIALLRNEARNKLLMSGSWLSVAKLRLLLFTVARWRCPYLIFSSCNVKFTRQSWKWLISFFVKEKSFLTVFNQIKHYLLLLIQIYIISKNGLSWPQLRVVIF